MGLEFPNPRAVVKYLYLFIYWVTMGKFEWKPLDILA